MYELTLRIKQEAPSDYPTHRTFICDSGAGLTVDESDVEEFKETFGPLPTIPGTAIWANTIDDPQANLDAFILTRYGLWFHANGIKSEKYEYKPEEIASWKPYSEHTPQPYD